MDVTQKDIEKLARALEEWQGGPISFNSFKDDHDRLILSLGCPRGEKESVGMSLFYCSYISGPVRWENSQLELSLANLDDGVVGIEVRDSRAGFLARCASISLFGQPGVTIPSS
ncbi:MAG: hypothetical protein KZQ97_21735 [Candidatus Thiodiazotropha sp. (ex Dulcina madagascariensis)]|nr:hypothetical protein [Candidatus Thiodiazotropha sp. (ex Dulcina madagascariensis)]